MSIYGVNTSASYAYQWQQQQLFSSTSGSSSQGSAASATASGAQSTTAGGGVDQSTLYSLVELARYAMDAMGVGANDRVTFNQIQAYKTEMEKKYADAIASGLESLGVDKNVSFRLALDDNGKIQVVSDAPDRNTIQKLFDDNPELTNQYKQIQALADLDAARKASQINPTEIRKRIQIENMAAWWQEEDNASSGLGVFDGNYAAIAGINTRV